METKLNLPIKYNIIIHINKRDLWTFQNEFYRSMLLASSRKIHTLKWNFLWVYGNDGNNK